MGDSAITCDEIIESYDEDLDTKARSNNEAKSYDETNFDGNRATCKNAKFLYLLAFLLITIALLMTVSIYCYLIKYRAKQLLPFHYRNNKLREVLYL